MFTPLRLQYLGFYYCLILLAHALGAEVATNSVGTEEVREAAVRAVGLVDRASSAFLTKRNCFACFQQDGAGIRLRDIIGVDNMLWGSDYPHVESTFPRSQELLKTSLAECSAQDESKDARSG